MALEESKGQNCSNNPEKSHLTSQLTNIGVLDIERCLVYWEHHMRQRYMVQNAACHFNLNWHHNDQLR